MTVVSISRGSYSMGAEVSRRVADKLGYSCLDRETLLRDLEEKLNIPEVDSAQAMESPTIFERLFGGKARYVAQIRAALLERLCADNIVYHGFASGFFLTGIPHALKVRIVADLAERVEIGVGQEGLSDQEARHRVEALDKNRRQWGLYFYGIDPEDPSLYDAVINVAKMGTEVATSMICDLVAQGPFRTTGQSQATMEDMTLRAAVEALLLNMPDSPDAEVLVNEGHVTLNLRSMPRVRGGTSSLFVNQYLQELHGRIMMRASSLPRLSSLEVHNVE